MCEEELQADADEDDSDGGYTGPWRLAGRRGKGKGKAGLESDFLRHLSEVFGVSVDEVSGTQRKRLQELLASQAKRARVAECS